MLCSRTAPASSSPAWTESGIVPGDITVKKGALTMQDKGISVPSADVTATGISLTGHTHTDSMGGGTSGPQ